MYHNLKEGAILIADAHYPAHKKEHFLKLLQDIKSQKISTSQLILMGDIFDLLVGNSPYLKSLFAKEIELLEEIAKDIEVIYLEGNHDFTLDVIFKNIKIVPIASQPLVLQCCGKLYGFSHGDRYRQTFGYLLYSKFIRNRLVLKILPDIIAKYMLNKMKHKKICKEISNFENIVEQIRKNYNTDYIIEGHFHQGKKIGNYISLPSFACTQEYTLFKNSQFHFISI
jgi:UDP-2,3-diacylglucosamine hydrolase